MSHPNPDVSFESSGKRRSWPSWLIVTLVFVGMVVVLGGVFAVRMMLSPHGGFNFVAAVKTSLPKIDTIPLIYETVGSVDAEHQVDLNVETPSVVQRILVREGQSVKAGQPLIVLRGDKQQADLAANQSMMAQSQAGVTVAEADVRVASENLTAASSRQKLAEAEFRRYETLWKKDFVATQMLDEKRSALDVASASYQSAVQAKQAAESRLGQAKAMAGTSGARVRQSAAYASDMVLRAPFDGVVGPKWVDLGDYILPSEKVIRVLKSSGLKAQFQVPEKHLPRLKTGLPVTVLPDVPGQEPVKTSVSFVDAYVMPDSRSVMVKAAFSASNDDWRPGQFVKIALTLGHKNKALLLPEASLIPQGERYFVYTVSPKLVAHFTPVTVGERIPGWVEITGGITSQTRIITDGIQKVQDGMTVKDVTSTSNKDAR